MAGERILVVEDTELLRRIYADKLAQEGYEVTTASDGLEALDIVRSEPVDLVLLDLIMPRVGGLEVLETLKQEPDTEHIPVIILSNLGQEADVERGLSLGAVDYLIKNQAKPAAVATKIRLTLDYISGRASGQPAFTLSVRDHEPARTPSSSTSSSSGGSGARPVRRSSRSSCCPRRTGRAGSTRTSSAPPARGVSSRGRSVRVGSFKG
ncbi:MAG: response regulator [Coriobacteriia bacterium]|nr:response regulator [Coriobacteriia bacterium]